MKDKETGLKTMSLGGVKVSQDDVKAMKKLWRSERDLDETFGAWVRRKLVYGKV